MRGLLIRLIRRYQAAGGGRALNVDCNFEPSCSHYAVGCLERFGLVKALGLIGSRIRRCTVRDLPKKKWDPVPDPD